MATIKLIIGSTRPVRVGTQLVDSVAPALAQATGADVEVVDLKQLDLPFLAEPQMPAMGNYTLEATQNWSEVVKGADAVVWLSPEYNGGMPASVKNAIDHLFAEWQDKPTMVIGYGFGGASRASKHLVEILGNMKANVVTEPVALAFGDNAPGADGLVAEPAAIVAAHEADLKAAAAKLAAVLAA
ncbi:NADPH-dependent FMN reductase [Propionibacteriaceae bacterium G1746]|uniref:NADPH-dependent FMN reductase n=1 Tax=Aestuariimicrobium sp. G57 TaxID=3418485 RepID=UPI003C161DF8